MNWAKTSYNTETYGAYYITGHAVMAEPGGYFFIAWHRQTALKGDCATAEEARQVCERHCAEAANARR